jgi:glutamate N-acetyltransferase/amino-acid N-acetyltransferase
MGTDVKNIPAEYSRIDGGVTAPRGFTAGAVYVGVKSRKSHKPDLAILYSANPCSCAALFTTNRFCAAPVILDRELLKRGAARAIVVNSGNANAGTGERGLRDAKAMEAEAERLLGLDAGEAFVCSTGVIGEYLPMEKILGGIGRIVPQLSAANGSDAAWAICTTDRVRKEASYELRLSGGTVRVGAMAKGSGMIHPNMATMLLFLTSDVRAESPDLQRMLAAAADKSFHMITVDGDTSTNDSAFLLANGASGVALASEADKAAFAALLEHICVDMAKRIASDGEGATHLIEVRAEGLPTERDARLAARSIAGSTLFKAAVSGRDANWGRIMAAAGYSGADVDPTHADCLIRSAAGEVEVMRDGFGVAFDEALASNVLSEHDVTVVVRFRQGNGAATAWGCDLTKEYVRINGDWRT